MRAKTLDKAVAINLRRKGFSYSEILKTLKVSKSSLSEWLRKVKITNPQIERLRSINAKARSLGSIALKEKRIKKTDEIIHKSKVQIKEINLETLRIIGSMLYWAEGSKQNTTKPSKELIFTNSDPKMIKVYLLWLKKCLLVERDNIKFEIYIHESYETKRENLSKHWSSITGFPVSMFGKIYFKRNKVNSTRKNRDKSYYGVLRVTVRKSTDMNRKVMGWVEGVYLKCVVE